MIHNKTLKKYLTCLQQYWLIFYTKMQYNCENEPSYFSNLPTIKIRLLLILCWHRAILSKIFIMDDHTQSLMLNKLKYLSIFSVGFVW